MAVIAYVSPVVGDGKSPDTAYRLAVADLAGPNSKYYIPTKPDGTPRFNWGFGIVNATPAVHAQIQVIAGVRPLDTLARARTALQTLGMQDKGNLRENLLALVRSLEPAFRDDEL